MYLYKFSNKDNKVLYVGKTESIVKRFYQHSKKPWWDEVKKIEIACINNHLVDMYERYYINLYKTLYNKKDINIKYNRFFLKELEWSEYTR